MAEFDFLYREPRPDGTVVNTPIDSSTPEGRELVERFRGTPNLVELTPETAQVIAEEQNIERARGRLQDLPPGVPEAIGAGVALVDELSMGTVPAMLSDAGQRRFEAARRESPTVYTGFRIGANVVPALLTAGEATAARAAMAATQGGLSELAGSAVQRALATHLVGRGMGPGLARTLGFGAGAAVDATVGGALQTITDANIQGQPIEGEQLLANIGVGLGLGLGMTGVRGLTEVRMPRFGQPPALRAPDVDDAAAIVDNGLGNDGVAQIAGRGRAVQEEASRFTDTLGQAMRVMGYDEAAVRQMRQVAADPRAFDNAGLIQRTRDLSTEIANDIQFSRAAFEPLTEASTRRAALYEDLSDVVPEMAERSALALRDLGRRLDEALASPRVLGVNASLLSQLRRLIPDALTEDPAAVFQVGGLQSVANTLDDALEVMRRERLLERATDGDTRALITEARQEIGVALGQLGRGGHLGARVHEVLDDLDRSWREGMGRLGRESARAGVFEVDEGRLFAGLKDSTYEVRTDVSTRLNRVYADMQRANAIADEVLGRTDGAAASQRILNTLALTEDTMDWATKVAAVTDLNTKASNNAGLQAAMRNFGFMVTGGLVGGVPGMAVGAGLNVLSTLAAHPLDLIRLRNRLTGVASGVTSSRVRMADGLGRLRAMLTGRRSDAVLRAPRKALSQLRDRSTQAQAYQTIVQQVQMLSSNPEALQDRVEMTAGDVSMTISPTIGGAVATSLVSAVHYLAANIPPASQPDPFAHVRPARPPSQIEMRAFLRRFEAIEDPLIILDLAAAQRLSHEHVEAVQAVYPHLLAEIRAGATEVLAQLERPAPYQARVQLGLVLGIDADASLRPEMVFSLQQTYAQTPEQDRAQTSVTGMVRFTENTLSEAVEPSRTF